MSSLVDSLKDAFTTRRARVAVVGLGYVGLPLAVEVASAGFQTVGYDVSQSRVDKITAGTSPVMDVPDAQLRQVRAGDVLTASTDPGVLAACDAVIICVPTPLRGNKEPDMHYIEEAAEAIACHRKSPQLIVLESTSYPGTTDQLLAGILRDAGAEIDEDTFLAFSPERVDPGNRQFRTKNIPKVVGGISARSAEVAASLYQAFLPDVHVVSSARVAETSKLLENTFRAVNIAMVNELAQLCHELGVDVWEVIEAASTKPFGFMPFYPGPGIGGHCIPLDPHFLAWSARVSGFEPRFIHIADQVNSSMPRYVVGRVIELLNDHRRALRDSRVLVFGVAYKSNVDDARESPALEVMALLEEYGAHVRYVDPYVATIQHKERQWSRSNLDAEALAWADVGLVLTDHNAFDWDDIVQKLDGPIFDTRNAIRSDSPRVAKL